MTNFRKHIVLVLLLLLPTGALPPSQPLAQMASVPGGKSGGSAAGLKAGQEANETRTIDLIGRGTIYRDDVARARDRAIADALQSAVEQAVGLVISQASVVEEFQLLSDRVYDQTKAFIHDYKVLTESKSGQYYRVVVRATVSMSAIKDKLQSIGILVVHKGMPMIMFFLSEQNIDDPSPTYWWGQSPLSTNLSVTEKALSEYMSEKGFIIVDRAALDPNAQLGPEYMEPELSDAAAVKLGKQLGADLVIIGEAVARYSSYESDKDTRSIQAMVSTRAIRTDSGMSIAASQGTGPVVHSDNRVGGTEALDLSASVVARDLVRQIVAKWRKDMRQPVLVELVVKGIREYADFVRFRTHLRNDVHSVRNLYLRSIKAGEATMDVDVMGNARTLADELTFQRFENFVVNISEVSEKGVKLELVPVLAPE